MKFRTLGKTELQVSEIGFGALEIGRDWGFDYRPRWAKSTLSESLRTLHKALESGVNFIDTAPAYQESEARIGQWLKEVRRADVILATKAGEVFDGESHYDFSYDAITQSIDESLRRLGTDYLDIVQLHNPSIAVLNQGEAFRALRDAKQNGKIRFTGLSADVETGMYGLVNAPFDVLQVDYSLLDASAMQQLLPLANQLSVGVIARSVLHRSALSRPLGQEPGVSQALFNRVAEIWQTVVRHSKESLPVSREVDYERLRTAAILFALSNPYIHCTLIGTRSAEHLEAGCHTTSLETFGEPFMAHLLEQAGGIDEKMRCAWVENPLLKYYHDREWGNHPDTDSRWFEFVVLETFQAGLSWKTILNKRQAFRVAFDDFDIEKVAAYTEDKIEELMGNPAIVRNRKKIESAVANAQIAKELADKYGSLQAFFLQYVDSTPDPLAALQKTFRFVGRTTAESIAQATGVVQAPHSQECWMCEENA